MYNTLFFKCDFDGRKEDQILYDLFYFYLLRVFKENEWIFTLWISLKIWSIDIGADKQKFERPVGIRLLP